MKELMISLLLWIGTNSTLMVENVILPQVKFIKSYAGKTKQNFVLELKSGNESVKLGMTIRSSSGGKLKQWSLKVTYNGIAK